MFTLTGLKYFFFFWQKFVELARQVGEFMTWKQVECPFEEDRSSLSYVFGSFDVISEAS